MGKLVVIDGLDGCGKSTQFELLIKYYTEQGKEVVPISFPDYASDSSALVKMYLNGDIAKDATQVNAYAASSFYAVDRYVNYKKHWETEYKKDNTIILASRYVTSNAIHQMTKLPKHEWLNYLRWLEDYEYNKLGLPYPDSVIFLDMPVEISQKLMTERYNGDESKKDIHEADVGYLNACRSAALYVAKKRSWCVVKCYENDEPLSIETINQIVRKKIDVRLND